MQNAAFEAIGRDDWRYELWDTPPNDLPMRMMLLRECDGVSGCNVTIPHKQSVIPFLDAVDIHAHAIGAVNTIVRTRPQSVAGAPTPFGARLVASLHGHNTDWTGFLADLAVHGCTVNGSTRALVLGAGGSARAVVYALVSQGAQVLVCNRTTARAHHLLAGVLNASHLPASQELCTVVTTPGDPRCSGVNLIVNCTSAGMWPNDDVSPWPADLPFPPHTVAYDLVYKPRVTRLMRQAVAAGARAIGGIGMLAEQGAAAFALWTGVPAARVSGIMRETLDHA
jgi:shikimate dehydrogenase